MSLESGVSIQHSGFVGAALVVAHAKKESAVRQRRTLPGF